MIGMSALSDIAYGYPEISHSSSLHPCGFSPRMYIIFVVVDHYPFVQSRVDSRRCMQGSASGPNTC